MRLIDVILLRRPSGLIYHYTSQTGLLGIVRTKQIWATNAHYQNDSKEFQYALELSAGIISGLSGYGTPPEEERLSRAMKGALESIKNLNIFVTSFSEHRDQLSQWRGYCPVGGGFAIGFEFDQIKTSIEAQGFRLVPCIYAQSDQYQILKDIADGVLKRYKNDLMSAVPIKRALKQRSDEYMMEVVQLAPLIKHYSFSEELEWRAVSPPTASTSPRVDYRAGVSMLIPYYNVDLTRGSDPLAIREVVVGPTPHMELSMSAVTWFASKHGISGFNVIRSSIPFRGW
jgi:hypothetical protein